MIEFLSILIILTSGSWAADAAQSANFSYEFEASTTEWQEQFKTDCDKASSFLAEILEVQNLMPGQTINVSFGAVGIKNAEAFFRNGTPHINVDKTFEGSWRAQILILHELVHLIRKIASPGEELWSNEGLAKLTETLYTGIWPATLENRLKNLSVFELTNAPSRYGSDDSGYVTSLFTMKYLFNRFGMRQFYKRLILSPLTGWDAIESTLQDLSNSKILRIPESLLTRDRIWNHLAFALLLNTSDTAISGLFLFDPDYTALLSDEKTQLIKGEPAKVQGELNWSIRYLRAKPKASIESTNSKLNAYRVMKKDFGYDIYEFLKPGEAQTLKDEGREKIYVLVNTPSDQSLTLYNK